MKKYIYTYISLSVLLSTILLLSFLLLLLMSATLIANNANNNEEIYITNKCNTWKYLEPEYLKKYTNTLQSKKVMQCYAISPAKRFRVHYDTTGIDAVSKLDLNKNNIPDYIDTVCSIFDDVYNVEVEQMQFVRPRTDGYDAEDTLYDIYVVELGIDGKGYYGECYPFKIYENNKYYSYVIIDNNYSITDSIVVNGKKVQCFYTTYSDAIKVTAAHEFFHAIQFTYGNGSRAMCEMNSVCMEILVYPEINDYLQYVNAMTKSINTFIFGEDINNYFSQYAYGIFLYMLHQKYGTDIMLNLWDATSKGTNSYKSLDSCLVLKQSSLAGEWYDFCEWIYYTGSRSVAGKYYPFANKIRDLQVTDALKFSQQENYVNYLEAYQLCFLRVTFPTGDLLVTADTADFLLTNLNTSEIINPTYYPKIQYILSFDNQAFADEANSIFDNKYWYSAKSQSEFANYLLFLHSGSVVKNISRAYPQPYCVSSDKFIYFPVSASLALGKEVDITIFDGDLKELTFVRSAVSIHKKNRVAILEPNLPMGVYIYTISIGGVNESVGKFVIK